MCRLVHLTLILVCGLLSTAIGQEKIVLDRRHLSIGFEFQTLGIWRVTGRFGEVWAEIAFNAKEPVLSRLKVVANTSSVSTESAAVDAYLRSASFLDAERHPIFSFESTKIEFTSRGTGVVTGNLTLLGVTRPISLPFQLLEQSPSTSSHKSIPAQRVQVRGILRRSEWGMTALAPAIDNEVRLEIEAELRTDR